MNGWWNEMKWNEMEWNGMEWSGMKWDLLGFQMKKISGIG